MKVFFSFSFKYKFCKDCDQGLVVCTVIDNFLFIIQQIDGVSVLSFLC